MHNIVLDTNVLVSALRSKHGVSQQIMRLIGQGHFRLNISVALALEYESVCKRKHLLPDWSEEDIDDLLDYLFTVGNLLPFVLRRRPILQDPRDECILESAIQSNSLIVTYNTRDFLGGGKVRDFDQDPWRISSDSESFFLGNKTTSIPVSIPIELYEKAKAIAEAENVPVGEVFASAFIDQLAARARFELRAARGSREKFLAALDKAPDVEPAPYDRLN